jgi:hypothetical protein
MEYRLGAVNLTAGQCRTGVQHAAIHPVLTETDESGTAAVGCRAFCWQSRNMCCDLFPALQSIVRFANLAGDEHTSPPDGQPPQRYSNREPVLSSAKSTLAVHGRATSPAPPRRQLHRNPASPLRTAAPHLPPPMDHA